MLQPSAFCRTPQVKRHPHSGWLLAGLIVLVSAVILALAGVTFYLTEHLRSTSLRQNQTKAIYLAQAGVMQAVYDFRTTAGGNGFGLGEYPVPTDTGTIGSYADDDVFQLGGQAADFLLVSMIPGTWFPAGICGGSANRQRLQDWTMRNVLITDSTTPTPPDGLPDGLPLVIDTLQISWEPDNGERVFRVDLMGGSADYSDCAGTPSGGTIDVNQTVAPLTEGAINRIWFSRRVSEPNLMSSKNWIQIRLTMTDGSVRRVRFVPLNPTTSTANFTMKSLGRVRKGPFPFGVWRRLQAEYRLNDDDVTMDFQEVGNVTSDTALLLAPSAPASEQRPGYAELSQASP